MGKNISIVINTLNDEVRIESLLKSLQWAEEIIICDMHSEDKTIEIAKKMGAKVFSHQKEEIVERARNFAVSKASKEWVLIIDPDEEVPETLKDRLIKISERMDQINYVRIPRKNLIFGHFMQASMWWPDLNIRFFRKGKVSWSDKVHRPPEVSGVGIDLPLEEQWAIVHHHYESVVSFLERMNRYTKVQADELKKEGYSFEWIDLIQKPLGEFLSRFFAGKGYMDGVHGLSLSLLQAFSHFILYLRLWEMDKFKPQDINLQELNVVSKKAGRDIDYWFKYGNLSNNPFKRFVQKVKNKTSLS